MTVQVFVPINAVKSQGLPWVSLITFTWNLIAVAICSVAKANQETEQESAFQPFFLVQAS